MRFYFFIALITFFALFQTPEQAKASIDETKKELQTLQTNLSKIKKTKTLTEKELNAQKKEIEKNRRALIKQTKKTREQERVLLDTSLKINKLTQPEKSAQNMLKGEKESLSLFLIALQRLSNTPTQSLLVKPEAPIKTARAQRVLQNTMSSIQIKTKKINNGIKKLQKTKKELRQKQLYLQEQTVQLEAKKADLEKLIDQKDKQLQSTENELDSYKKQVHSLAENASSLQELLKKLETEETLNKLALPTKKPLRKQKEKTIPDSFSFNESSYLPVVGFISRNFGEKNEYGVTNKGIEIKGSKGSTVTTPFSGTVKFAGPFKHYQKIIIIEHPNNQLSLIGGLEKLYTKTGQYISAGEPLGTLGGFRGATSHLYYELRNKGKQIDPQKYLLKLAKAAQKT